jgi:hypothetical protein
MSSNVIECKSAPKIPKNMSNQDTQAVSSVSWSEGMSGVVATQALDDDWNPAPDAPTTDVTMAIDGTLHLTAGLARRLIGAHQAAASLIIRGNWRGMRKYFVGAGCILLKTKRGRISVKSALR